MQGEIFQNEGWWWPKYDKNPDKCLRKVRLCLQDMMTAVELAKDDKLCIQAGGHAGIWPLELSKHFQIVRTFEPEKTLYNCMIRNLNEHNAQGVFPSDQALGPVIGKEKLKSHPSAGSWRISDQGQHEVDQITIDSLNLKNCDAIFLDVEHYEIPVLKGALRTIEEFRPVLHVEILKGEESDMADFMNSIRYKHVKQINSDHVYVSK